MKTTSTAAGTCPRCGYKFDHATGVAHDNLPKPGDFSLCLRCGQVLRFEAGLVAVIALDRELEELAPEQRALIRRAQRAIPTLWQEGRRRA